MRKIDERRFIFSSSLLLYCDKDITIIADDKHEALRHLSNKFRSFSFVKKSTAKFRSPSFVKKSTANDENKNITYAYIELRAHMKHYLENYSTKTEIFIDCKYRVQEIKVSALTVLSYYEVIDEHFEPVEFWSIGIQLLEEEAKKRRENELIYRGINSPL